MTTTTKEFNARHGAVIGTSSANYLQLLGNTTGNAVQIAAQGSDTNISIELKPKGTGTVNISANIVNNSNETALAFIPSGATVPTNGLFLPAGNTIGLATNSTERLRIDASGNVLIGTTTNTNSSQLLVNGVIESTTGFLAQSQLQYLYNTSAYPAARPSLLLDFIDSNVIDPRITVSRNSPAMYYDGKTSAMAEQNLLTYSQDFRDTATAGSTRPWTLSNTTVAVGATAPDGTTTAYTITASVANGYFTQNTTVPLGTGSSTFCFSVYLKAGTVTSCRVYLYSLANGGYNSYVDVNLAAGTIGSAAGFWTNTPFITSMGNGWYRVGIVTIPTAVAANGNAAVVVYNNTSSGNYYAWGAQFEQRSAVTAYTPTTSASITNYIPQLMSAPINSARLDFDPVTRKSLGLLLEEARINLVSYSNDFSNPGWTKPSSSIAPNSTVAPDGTISATLLYPSSTGTYRGAYATVSVSSGIFTTSVYAKYAGIPYLYIVDIAGAAARTYFNLQTGLPGTTTTGYTSNMSAVGNGWYRCSLTNTSNLSSTYMQFGMCDTDASPTATASNTKGIFIWGAQLEAGPFASSYIPTTAGTGSRIADTPTMTGTNFSSWYNQNQGTFVVEATDDSGVNRYAALFGIPVNAGYSQVMWKNLTNIGYRYNYSTATTDISSNINPGATTFKCAIRYSNVGCSVITNNSSVVSSANPLQLIGTSFQIGWFDSTTIWNGHIRKIIYYPVASADTELKGLTTL